MRPSSHVKNCASVFHTNHWQRTPRQGTKKAGSTRRCFTPNLKVHSVDNVMATEVKQEPPSSCRPSRGPRLPLWPFRGLCRFSHRPTASHLCEDGTAGRAVLHTVSVSRRASRPRWTCVQISYSSSTAHLILLHLKSQKKRPSRDCSPWVKA